MTESSVLGELSLFRGQTHTHVITSVSSPGSLKSPSTNTDVLVKLWTLHVCPSSMLNLRQKCLMWCCISGMHQSYKKVVYCIIHHVTSLCFEVRHLLTKYENDLFSH